MNPLQTGMLSCPDCLATADFSAAYVVHDPTCPLGRTTEATCARDQAWFETHPGSSWYWRNTTVDERAEARIGAVFLPQGSRTRVVNVGNGGTVRALYFRGEARLLVHSLPPAGGWCAA